MSEIGVFLRDLGVWLYNFYFLAVIFVIRQVWFLFSLAGFAIILATAQREEKNARDAQRVGHVSLRPYSADSLRRTRR